MGEVEARERGCYFTVIIDKTPVEIGKATFTYIYINSLLTPVGGLCVFLNLGSSTRYLGV